jgi:hypothetical protein
MIVGNFLFEGFYFFYFRKFSLEEADLDDADEDENTIYRGLAVPVDIRQVVEVRKFKILFQDLFIFLRYLMVII